MKRRSFLASLPLGALAGGMALHGVAHSADPIDRPGGGGGCSVTVGGSLFGSTKKS